jgi:ADP-ribose pyrophosphatase YjhB (NUDIX family)
MKLLAEISEGSLGIGEPEQLHKRYELQKSARGIVLNAQGKMAGQYLKTHAFHKLPGGGVEQGETLEAAFKREILEEVGCNLEVTDELGVVVEYRNMFDIIIVSYGFVASVKGEVNEPQLEKEEIEEGTTTVWMTPEEAYEEMKADTPKVPKGYFILKREMSFLEEFLKRQEATSDT